MVFVELGVAVLVLVCVKVGETVAVKVGVTDDVFVCVTVLVKVGVIV